MMPRKPRKSLLLTAPQLEALGTEAERLGITIGELLRRIVDEWRKRLRP